MKKALILLFFFVPISTYSTTTCLGNLGYPIIQKEKTPPDKDDKDNELAEKSHQIKTIVLDAGHGGKDAGCSGKKSKEKNIALNIVLSLGKAIEEQFPDVQVIYTRKRDIFIPLHERAAIANRNNADLFISIHCNALGRNSHLVSGSETYVMGLHTAEHNLEVARRENESILLEEDYEKNYQGFDPNSDEGHIFLSLFQNAFLDQSILFAEKVETKIKRKANRKSRGVKQAGFVVLKETTMPSVLIETGYLTHSMEEAFLATQSGQSKIALAIFEAFKDYKTEIEGSSVADLNPVIALSRPEEATKYNSQKKRNKSPKTDIKAIPANLIVSNPEAKKPKKTSGAETNREEIVFKIQLAASPNEIKTSNRKWSQIPYVEVRKEKKLYKYLTGSHQQYETAVKNRNEVLSMGFSGAFVVAYKAGKRIPLSEAQASLKK